MFIRSHKKATAKKLMSQRRMGGFISKVNAMKVLLLLSCSAAILMTGAFVFAFLGIAENSGRKEGDNFEHVIPNIEPTFFTCTKLPTLTDLHVENITIYKEKMYFIQKRAIEAGKDYDNNLKNLNDVQSRYTNPRFETLYNATLYISNVSEGLKIDEIFAWDDSNFIYRDDVTGWKPSFLQKRRMDAADFTKAESHTRNLEGEFVGFFSWFQGNFGHFLHDHLPMVSLLNEHVNPTTKFLLQHHELSSGILDLVDPTFLKERVEWVYAGEKIEINGNLTILSQELPKGVRSVQVIESLRRWLLQNLRPDLQSEDERVIIFYTRNGPDLYHGRAIEPSHERDMIEIIKESMQRYGKNEKLVIYDGLDGGKTMSLENQFKLFRSAETVIGPHGSGMANVIWLDPFHTSCNDRPQVLELIMGKYSRQVQVGGSSKTYYNLYSTIPWVDYHHVHFDANSTSETCYVNLEAFRKALDIMWG